MPLWLNKFITEMIVYKYNRTQPGKIGEVIPDNTQLEDYKIPNIIARSFS